MTPTISAARSGATCTTSETPEPDRSAVPTRDTERRTAAAEQRRTRSHCVMWLCGQCHGGRNCRCIPSEEAS